VSKGKALEARDIKLLGTSTSDPYVLIAINGEEKARSNVAKKTLEPIWGSECTAEFTAVDR